MTNFRTTMAIVTLGAIGVSSCVADRIPSYGNSPTYPSGYRDGCASATEAEKKFATKVIRDEVMFKSDAGYREGWRQGYLACSSDKVFQEEQDPFSPSS